MNSDPTINDKTKDYPDTLEEEEKENGDGPKDFQLRITAIRNATKESNKSVVKTNQKGSYLLFSFTYLILILSVLANNLGLLNWFRVLFKIKRRKLYCV